MIDTEALIDRAIKRIVSATKAGDISGVRQVLRDLLETATAAAAAQAHQKRIGEIGDDTIAACRYFGELGITKAEAEKHLGKLLSLDEQEAMAKGTFDRRAEARALEIGQARQGGKVLPWLTSRV